MKEILKKSASILMLLITLSVLVTTGSAEAASNTDVSITHIYAAFDDDKPLDVLYQVMEVESGVMAPIALNIELAQEVSGLTYRVYQYEASGKKKYDIISSGSSSFSFYADELRKDIPLYLAVYKGNDLLVTKLMVIRVNPGRSENMVVSEIGSEYKDNIEVKMDELLPGMKFEMYPYIIPISVKAFTDGRVVIGMGINSNNVSFWKDARNGTLKQKADVKELSDAFWGNSENRSAVKGKNMGLVVNFSGWVQGNMYTNEPLKGQLSLYVGSGFNVSGQYAILTWDVTVTAGAAGVLDFSFLYNEENSKYDEFVVDEFSMQFSAALELYGGIGLSSIASAGVYGSGSVTLIDQLYPDASVRSLMLAGECGFKVKAFSRTLFSYAIVSGSHEFVEDRVSSSSGEKALLNVSGMNEIGKNLLGVSYADVTSPVSEPDDSGSWYTGQTVSGTLGGYETDPDFDHMIAENVYPDNHLKAVKTGGSTAPQINVVFLGSDPSRSNGNRSRLMNFYYRESTSFISDPSWILDDSADDGTADYNPEVFRSDLGGRTYLIWQNALSEVGNDDSFREIAKNTDLFFAEVSVGSAWKNVSRITYFADDSGSEVFAAGAKVWEDWDGEPLVTYYTNEASDPIGAGTSASHDIYVARMQDGEWVNEKAFSVTGQVTDVACAYFHKEHTVAVCYNTDGPETVSGRSYYLELWQKADGVWTRVFSRTGEGGRMIASAKYIKTYKNQNLLTWYENNRVFYMLNETYGARALFGDDTPVPTPEYEIYGTLIDGNLAVVGTYSKESKENAFAIYSPNGSSGWARLDLTDIGENAIVNGISVAFTEEDEPIVFYSVQNYLLNTDLDTSYYTGGADALLAAPLRGSFEGLGSGLLLGQDDPRFIDTSTDLYVRARRANQRVRISDVSFDDVAGARKGSDTPATIQVQNNGMYSIGNVTVYLNGEKLSDHEVFIRNGETQPVSISLPVPAGAPNEPLDYELSIGCREGIIDDSCTATLSPGEIFVSYSQQLLYGNESLAYSVTAAGFANRKVMAYLFDEDTGEMIYSYPLAVAAGQTVTSQTSRASGLYVQDGHTHIKAYLLDETETAQVYEGMPLGQFEELLQLPSTRSYVFRGLDTIYLQDVSNAFKLTSEQPSGNSSESSSGSTWTPSSEDTSAAPSEEPVTETPDTEDPDGGEDGSGSVPSGEPVTPSVPVPTPDTDPGNVTEPGENTGSRSKWILPLAAGAGGLGLMILFILLFLKRRKDDEEEE